jgi:hypothetical protein
MKTKRTPPKRRQCGTMAVHHRLLEQHPEFRQRQMNMEAAISRRLAAGPARRVGVTRIPVVVHVVYNDSSENISIGQVKSQIRALNRDYRAKNGDKSKVPGVWSGLVTDVQVVFFLASKDPTGKPTNGITRAKTTRTEFGDDDSVKSRASGGADPWPSNKYLNLWVCTLAGSLLGYAQFPGGPAATDGVVILNTGFGTTGTAAAPFNLGRTAVHEVGHWLNLHHIWGDGSLHSCSDSDFVDDTPNQEGPNYGKPTFPHVSCQNSPNGDMFMNYLDYVDDAAMLMFTPQQVVRMQATLDGPRSSLGV